MANKKKISTAEAIDQVAKEWVDASLQAGIPYLDELDISYWQIDLLNKENLIKFDPRWSVILARASTDKRYKGLTRDQAVESMQEIAQKMAVGLLQSKMEKLQKQEVARARAQQARLAQEAVLKMTQLRDRVVDGDQIDEIFPELRPFLDENEEFLSSVYGAEWQVFLDAWTTLGYDMMVQPHITWKEIRNVYEHSSTRLHMTIGRAFRDHPLLSIWMDFIDFEGIRFIRYFSLICIRNNLNLSEELFEEEFLVRILKDVFIPMFGEPTKDVSDEAYVQFHTSKLRDYAEDFRGVWTQSLASHLLAKVFKLGDKRGINVLEKLLEDQS